VTAILDSHSARVTTATVEVKCLTISNKQITQSVFKQIKCENLLEDDGRLNGTPWGQVNYHPDKCADHTSHLHVVWQRDEELLRSTIAPTHPIPFWTKTASSSNYMQAAYCLNKHKKPPWARLSPTDYKSWEFSMCDGKLTVLAKAPRGCPYSFTDHAYCGHRAERCTDVFEGHECTAESVDALFGPLRTDVEMEFNRLDSRKLAYERLRSLPQLFIAV
jgi:hypothetical protein